MNQEPEGDSLKVLVTEGDAGSSARLVQALESAGHEVIRCHEVGLGRVPCVGLTGVPCPLSDPGADVAVSVRRRPHPRLRIEEFGAVCGLRDGVPLILVGNTAMHPLEAQASIDLGGATTGHVLAALDEVAADTG